MTNRLRRVSIVAENASVRFGGEAILPYHYFRLLLARGVDVHLIVHERVRAELVELFPTELGRMHFVADQGMQKVAFRLGRMLPRRIDEATLGLLNQMLTQRAQRAVVRGLAGEGTVVHQPIPVSPRFPSLMYGLGAPVVIGPMNGGMEYPAAFGGAGAMTRWVIAFGRMFTDAVNAFFPGKREAAVLLVANERTRMALPGEVLGQVKMLAENGVDLEQWAGGGQPEAATFVFIGRLVDWKALNVAIEAIARVPAASLDVIGDGVMLAPWRTLAEQLGVAGRVRFLGWRTQAECAERLAGCCALVLPSVYECGGAVVLEAMAAGRPVIATDWGGPADYLDASCGMLVAPSSVESMIAGFAAAMQDLLASPEKRKAMGAAGRRKVEEQYDWQRKMDAMLAVYEEALEISLQG